MNKPLFQYGETLVYYEFSWPTLLASLGLLLAVTLGVVWLVRRKRSTD